MRNLHFPAFRPVMPLIYLFLSVFGAGCFAFATQKTPPPLPSENDFIDHVNSNFTKYSLTKRLGAYPFNKAAKVKIVAYNLELDFHHIDALPDSFGKINEEVQITHVMKHNDYSKMDQMQELNSDQIARISDILYNSCARHSNPDRAQMGCYYPRNAILFVDKSNHIFDYFEVCFDCRGIKTDKKFPLLEKSLCAPAYEDLEHYFNALGVETKSRLENK